MPGNGVKERQFMKKNQRKSKFDDEPIGALTRIDDFLPPPEKLLPKEEAVKITLTVDSDTIMFFKKVAAKSGTKYQRMMREVLKGYAKKFGT